MLNRIKLWPQQNSATNMSSSNCSLDQSLSFTSMQRVTPLNTSVGTSGIYDEEIKIAQDMAKPSDYFDEQELQPKVYPFKADEFGKLELPENVLTAKLVSLNNNSAGKTM